MNKTYMKNKKNNNDNKWKDKTRQRREKGKERCCLPAWGVEKATPGGQKRMLGGQKNWARAKLVKSEEFLCGDDFYPSVVYVQGFFLLDLQLDSICFIASLLSPSRDEAPMHLDDVEGMVTCAFEANTIIDNVNGLSFEHVIVVLLVVVLGAHWVRSYKRAWLKKDL